LSTHALRCRKRLLPGTATVCTSLRLSLPAGRAGTDAQTRRHAEPMHTQHPIRALARRCADAQTRRIDPQTKASASTDARTTSMPTRAARAAPSRNAQRSCADSWNNLTHNQSANSSRHAHRCADARTRRHARRETRTIGSGSWAGATKRRAADRESRRGRTMRARAQRETQIGETRHAKRDWAKRRRADAQTRRHAEPIHARGTSSGISCSSSSRSSSSSHHCNRWTFSLTGN